MRPTKADPVDHARAIVQGCLAREFCRFSGEEVQQGAMPVAQGAFEHYRAAFQIPGNGVRTEDCFQRRPAGREVRRVATVIASLMLSIVAVTFFLILR